tara:strand:- start:3430 stop:4233 length:804 start_codon:yes stop_codon:yes gene_type:complete
MSATIIDTPVEDKADTTEVPATLAEVLAPVQEQPAAQPEPVVDDVPAKYQGKSIQDIIQMHQNAESLAGRQSSEVGELRKIVDDFIVTQSNSTKETQPEENDDLHFLDNPNEAVNRAIDKHPSIVRANEIAASTAQVQANQEAQDRLLAAHPDTSEVISDSKFAEWIQSSKSRTRALQTANSSNNVEAMSELLSEYKSSKPVTDTSGVPSKKDSARHASTGAISGNSESSKKVFRRADLIKLKMSDPDRYSQLQPEIMAAYAEKRVI